MAQVERYWFTGAMVATVNQEMLMTRQSPARTALSPKAAPGAKPKAPRPTVKTKVPRKLTSNPIVKSRSTPTSKRAAPKALAAPTAAAAASDSSKQAQLIATLRSATGVPLGQMMALTGWQAHTVRAVISAVLRKKLGLKVTCEAAPDGGERLYRIVGQT